MNRENNLQLDPPPADDEKPTPRKDQPADDSEISIAGHCIGEM